LAVPQAASDGATRADESSTCIPLYADTIFALFFQQEIAFFPVSADQQSHSKGVSGQHTLNSEQYEQLTTIQKYPV